MILLIANYLNVCQVFLKQDDVLTALIKSQYDVHILVVSMTVRLADLIGQTKEKWRSRSPLLDSTLKRGKIRCMEEKGDRLLSNPIFLASLSLISLIPTKLFACFRYPLSRTVRRFSQYVLLQSLQFFASYGFIDILSPIVRQFYR